MLAFYNNRPTLARTLSEPREYQTSTYARVDIDEREDAITLSADLPGLTLENIEITLNDGLLTISGKREPTAASHRRERATGSFERSFRLGTALDQEQIAAAYCNGVLTLTLPKKEAAKARQIPVKIN